MKPPWRSMRRIRSLAPFAWEMPPRAAPALAHADPRRAAASRNAPKGLTPGLIGCLGRRVKQPGSRRSTGSAVCPARAECAGHAVLALQQQTTKGSRDTTPAEIAVGSFYGLLR